MGGIYYSFFGIQNYFFKPNGKAHGKKIVTPTLMEIGKIAKVITNVEFIDF